MFAIIGTRNLAIVFLALLMWQGEKVKDVERDVQLLITELRQMPIDAEKVTIIRAIAAASNTYFDMCVNIFLFGVKMGQTTN